MLNLLSRQCAPEGVRHPMTEHIPHHAATPSRKKEEERTTLCIATVNYKKTLTLAGAHELHFLPSL